MDNCTPGQHAFVNCLAKYLNNVESVKGNVITTDRITYKVIIKGECYFSNKNCYIEARYKNDSPKNAPLIYTIRSIDSDDKFYYYH